MKKLLGISLAATVAASTFIGCNSDYTVPESVYSNVAVQSFNLQADEKVLDNLDSVFFSIDLVKGRIFNADSLPYGTAINKLVPKILMMETVSRAELTVRLASGKDTVYNYLENSTDTIDFSNGPVRLSVTSLSATATAEYSIEVLVHTLKSDSLVWHQMAKRELPTSLDNVKEQKTVRANDVTYCLASDGSIYTIARKEGVSDMWEESTPALPADAAVNSLTACGDKLYVLAIPAGEVNGALYVSADGGAKWNATGMKMAYIYGAYGDVILGNMFDGVYKSVEYPAGGHVSAELPAGMPVKATSQTNSFKFPLGQDAVVAFVGGQAADGTYSNGTWAYDGTVWTNIAVTPLGTAMGGMTLVPFYTYRTNNQFIVTEYNILMAFGGMADGKTNRKVYISYDYGMNWAEGGELIQLPDYIPDFAFAQAYVEELTLESRAYSPWREYATDYRIPATASFEALSLYPASRATTSVSSWNCPFIYLYGGMQSDGTCSDTIWRGTLNRLVFKPII